MKRDKVERGFVLFGKIMLVAVILLNAWMTYKYYYNFISSDDASELILSRILASDGGILSKNWHYSTELRILNTQLIFSVLFRFISDFKTVRILGQIIMTCILMLSYYFCLSSIDREFARERFWKTAFLLALPIGWSWIFLVMKMYYVPHVAITFFAFGFACQMQKEDMDSKKRTLILICGGLLAFIACMEGIRHLQLVYLPLALSTVWMLWNSLENNGWNVKNIHISRGGLANLCWLCCAAAGYLVNTKVLSKVYFFKSFEDKKFTEVLGFENIQQVMNGLLEILGYTGEKEMLSAGGICNAIAIVLACFLIIFLVSIAVNMKKYEQEDQLILSFIILSFALSMFIYIGLNSVEPRWVMVCVAPMVLLFMFLEGFQFLKRYVLLGGIYCIALLLGGNIYHEIKVYDRNEDMRNVYDFVMENDYTFGYSTFWSGNLLTELTNGRFRARSVIANYECNKLILWYWLTPIEVEYEDGPILCILEKRRVEDLPFPENWTLLMEDDAYMIYELPDHREAEEYFLKRN